MGAAIAELGRTVFTSSQVARICKVSPRTVCKLFDAGVLGGYKIPGSNDRRIPRKDLLCFLKEHKFPLGPLERDEEYHVLTVGLDRFTRDRLAELLPESEGFHWQDAATGFDAGYVLADLLHPDAMLIDLAMGRGEGLAIAARVLGKALYRGMAVVLIACEDDRDEYEVAGYSAVYRRPFDVALLVEHLRGRAAGKWGE